jgi:hypothetical protein
VLPAPQVEGLSASVSQGETGATIKLDAQDKEGRPLNFLQARATLIDPELTSQQVDLSQVGAGQYAAQVDLPASGTYLVRLGVNQGDASLGQMTLGLVVPYSPEYRLTGVNTGLLGELARRSGASGTGEILDPLAAFVHNLPSADYAREIWRSLLLVAALLFPLDVAVRRVMFTAQDYRKARAWVAGRLAFGRQPQPSQDRALGRLFSARQRARQRTGQRFADQPEAPGVRRELPSVRPAHPSQTPAPPPAAADAPAPEKPAPARTETEEESFARLRQAKRRARRDR